MILKGVILYKCGQNINRAYRLCYTFGVSDLYLIGCNNPKVGNVYSAKDHVTVHIIDDTGGMGKIAALEKGTGAPISEEIKEFDYLLVGGENVTLRNKMADKFFHIKTDNPLCLTVDQALAVGLHYASR